MRVSIGAVIGGAFAAVVALGACGAGGSNSSAPPTTGAATGASTAPSTTAPAGTTIPTVPPTTASTTTAATTPADSTTAPSTTAAASTTSSSSTAAASTTTAAAPKGVGALACKTAQLTASLGGGNAAAGTFYYNLTFRNGGSSACTLYGYPGVSYVAGAEGTQAGSPADRNPSISGQSTPTVVTLAAGGTAHAVVAEVDVGNYPATTCDPVAVRGLRVYPPGQTAALFVPQSTTGCQATGVHQLGVGFIVP